MPDEEKKLVADAGKAADKAEDDKAAKGGAQTGAQAGAAGDVQADGVAHKSSSRLGTRRESAMKEEEAFVAAFLHLVRKKLGKHFKETRNLVILAVVVAGLCCYVVLSSKYILDKMRSHGEDKEPPTPKTTEFERFTYPPGCVDDDDIVCIPEAKYIREHVFGKPCDDFYGFVCNDNYFYSEDRSDYTLWPYRYASLEFAYVTLQNYILKTLKNFEAPLQQTYANTGFMKTMMFLKNCSSEEDSRKHHVGHLKRALYETGLPSSPYDRNRTTGLPDVAEALAKVMRMLNLKIFFVVDFEEDTTGLYADSAPENKLVTLRKLPMNTKITERKRDDVGTEKSEFIYNMLKTRHFIPPGFKLFDYIGQQFYEFAEVMAKESISSTFQEKTRILNISDLPGFTPVGGRRFDWVKFFNTLLPSKNFTFTNSTVISVHDHDHLVSVTEGLLTRSTHDVLNYILLAVWSYYTPLLPMQYTKNMRYLPNTDYVSITKNDNFQSCIKLAEAFCPKGMLAVIRTVIMGHGSASDYSIWLVPLVEYYKNRLNEFVANGLSKLVGAKIAEDFAAKFIDKADINVAIPAIMAKKTIEELNCAFDVDQVTTNQTLTYFKEAVRSSNEWLWHDRFYTNTPVYTPPIESNFVYDVSFNPGEIFIPLSYVLPVIKYPRLWEMYVWMSLPDVFQALVRTMYRTSAKKGDVTVYGEEVVKTTKTAGTCVTKLIGEYLNISQPFTAEEHWFLGLCLVYKWMVNFTMLAWTTVPDIESRGFKESEKDLLPYVLMAEAACRKYLRSSVTWNTMLYFGIVPGAMINVGLWDHEGFAKAFNCTPGDLMVADKICRLNKPQENPIPIHHSGFIY